MSATIKYLRFALFAALFLIVSCKNETQRPRDPWVFRSVLDQKPRMVTAALHNDLYVAYDARQCQLYKAWKGGVVFDGAVYTTRHGPQPTTKGYAYYQQPEDGNFWYLVQDGSESPATAKFRGYYFRNGQVTFRYTLSNEKGAVGQVEETPEYESRDGKTGFKRVFHLSEVPEGVQVKIKTNLTSLETADDYATNGKLTITAQNTREHSQGSLQELQVELLLEAGKDTYLTVFYHPGFDSGDGDEEKALVADKLAQGAALIETSDCKTCHNEKVKTIGPSYVDIAKRYPNTPGMVKVLANKIIQGGSGTWGDVPMTPHPDLTPENAEIIASYILSLDNEIPAKEDLLAGTAPISFPFDDKNEFEKEEEGKEYPGLAVSVYHMERHDMDLHTIPDITDPAYTAVAPGVHFGEELFADYPEVREDVYMHFKGYLNVEEEDNYVIRLVSDDGSRLYLDGKLLIDNDGFHSARPKDSEVILKKGKHTIEIRYFQGLGGLALSLQWAKHGDPVFSVIPASVLTHTRDHFKKSVPYVPMSVLVRNVPGDRGEVAGVHPSFDLAQARPSHFQPKVGGMDFLSDGSMVVCTWDSLGPVYRLEGVTGNDPEKIKVTRIASGLAEPLGLKVVNDTIYVLQKQELTCLIDNDKDGIIDEYRTLSDNWRVSANFHEFAFGLAYRDGYFYAALATAIQPGGASAKPQIPDRGKVVRISKKDGSTDFIASGLRTPNGIGFGADGELFVTDNQGDWLPSSKVLHVTEGAWFGSRSVDFEGTANLREKLPVVWLPQDEIGNSPSQPIAVNVGPYAGQQLHGEVTHGGLKRVFVEKVGGEYQGAVFRFTQGLEAGVNRVVWGPDGALYIGGIGNPGNWGHSGKLWYGLQKLTYNGNPTFEMLAVRARANGMEIEMTEPVAEGYGESVSDYEVRQWYYKPTENYGGPKLDERTLPVKAIHFSDDRKKIFLELEGMKPNHVVYIRLKGSFLSREERSLWSTEAWYTLNRIPETKGFHNPVKAIAPNTLTEAEKAAGWKLLFDGKTTAGWRSYKGKTTGPAWKVKDGALYLDVAKKDDWQTVGGGDIITEGIYENYELVLEWKISKCGNSGVIFNVVEGDEYEYVWQTGPELQVLDNTCHPDGRIEKHRAGDLYDLIKSRHVTAHPAGEWNRLRMIAKDGTYEVWLNGYKTVTFTLHTPEWDELVKNSKFAKMPGFGKSRKGHISLQDHGDPVWYRNIKIREIK